MGATHQALIMTAGAASGPPGPGDVADSYPSYVQLLLHANGTGTDGLTLIDDSSYQRTPIKDTGGGASSFDTSVKKWGSSSYNKVGAIHYRANPAFALGSADWTMEGWVYLASSLASGGAILARRDGTISTTGGWCFGINGRNLTLRAKINGTWSDTKLDSSRTTSQVPLTQWSHVAIARVGSTLYAFIDGALADSQAVSGTVDDHNTALCIGTARTDSAEWPDSFRFDDVRFTVGVGRYSAAFTPPIGPFASPSPSPAARTAVENTSADPNWANVSLLMHCDGSNGSTTFTDVKDATAYTVAGNAQLTTSSPKFGSACAIFDGTGDYIERAAAAGVLLGSADFCIEFWLDPTMGAGTSGKLAGIWYDTSGSGFSYKLSGTQNFMKFYYSTTGGNFFIPWTVYGLNLNAAQWYHVALVRDGADLTLYIDGDPVVTGSVGSDVFKAVTSAKKFEIGRDGAGNVNYLKGRMDEIRITKAARYTGRFTPPVAAFAEA